MSAKPPVQWDGSPDALIESETDPWVSDPTGLTVDLVVAGDGVLGECGELGHFLPGVLAPMNTDEGIERCDACATFDSDLDAARAVATSFGVGFTVWFHGTNGHGG